MASINIHKNHILRNINHEEWQILEPHIEYVAFEPGAISDQRDLGELFVYFVLTGLFALTIRVDEQDTAFVLLGHDNIIDSTVPTDNGLDVVRAVCLTNLTAYALPAHVAKALLPRLPSLHAGLQTANLNLFMKMARVTACSQHHTSHQRLASWLLRASDLTENPRLNISHRALAQLLGIRRPGATVELAKLKASSAIITGYGWIEIKDRYVLEQHACSCHSANAMILKP